MTTVLTGNKTVSWTLATNADQYQVFADGNLIGQVNAPPLVIQVPENTTQQITVQGINGAGPGTLSDPAPATVGNLTPPPISNLRSYGVTSSSVAATWDYDPTADFSQYVITTTAGTLSVDTGNRIATVSGLGASVSVTITVAARDTGGLTSSTVSLNLTTSPAPPAGAPGAPTNLRATRIGYSSADMAWDAMPGATSYQVSGDQGAHWSAGQTGTTYPWTGLTESTYYIFYVRAVGAGGTSPNSTKGLNTLPKVQSSTPVYVRKQYGYGQANAWSPTGIDYLTSGVGSSQNGWASSQYLTALDLNTNTGPYNASAGSYLDYSFTLNFDAIYQVWVLWGYPGTYEWYAWDTAGTIVQHGKTVVDATAGVWLGPNVSNNQSGLRINRLRLLFTAGGVGTGVFKLRELAVDLKVIDHYNVVNNPA